MASEKRQGPSISVKMILTTTALVVMIVVGFGALSIWSIGNLFDESVRDKEKLISGQLHKVGSATVQTVASSSRVFLETSNDADLRKYIAELGRKDPELSMVYVLDGNRGLTAHSDESRNVSGHPVITDEKSWSRVQEIWSARRGKVDQQDPLVASETFGEGVGRLGLFAMPIFPSQGQGTVDAIFSDADGARPLGYVVIGYSYKSLDEAVANAKSQKEKAYRDTGIKTAGVGGLFMLLGTLLAILQGLRISKPIKMLAWRADQIARGDLASRVEVTSTDEIGLLGENFNYMADQLVVLLRETAEKATLEKELEVARTIQETLVPGLDTVDRNYVKLAGFFEPASQCGGDWWTYHDLKDGKVLVVIGDVTGHGVPSAMITAAAKAACDVARAVNHDDVGASQLLEIMNRAIYESAKRKFVMTCFASIIDPNAKSITYANAGHNFPYIYRLTNGAGEFGSLMTRGNRLGDLQDSKYVAKTQPLHAGDVLVWYTDGIIECENERGEEFGEKRFRSAIRQASALEPAEIREALVASSHQFFGERPRKDDITMVVARIY
jgi:serine phosphatase RsbU (regulator of sigma subunit)